MACTGSTLLFTLTGYISSGETTNRLGAWPVLMYYPVIFLNGLGGAVKICIDVRRRHVAILLVSLFYVACHTSNYIAWKSATQFLGRIPGLTRQAMYVQNCCSGKALSITCSEGVCSLRFLACNVYAPYCHLWPVWRCNIFPHYLIIGTILEENVIDHKMCVLIFCSSFVWNISHFEKNWARYDQKYILVFM
jgi:hypothetical protein